MKIGLFGFTFGHENMGCQALTCSFLGLLRDNFTDERFEVVNFHDEYSLGNIPELFPGMTFSKYHVSLKRKLPEFIRQIKSCDIVFDETFGDGFSDIYFTKSVLKNVITKITSSMIGTPFILTPQTYGPFKRTSLEWLASRAIRLSTKAYARDKMSSDYASKISHRDVKTVTDLAFLLPYKKILPNSSTKRIGINVSGLLWQGGFNGVSNQFGLQVNYQQYCRDIIKYYLNIGLEVHIIPHVTVSADPNRSIPDGDYPACKEICKEFQDAILAPCFDNPYDVKNYIASMDYFIGSRMHATIAAFSAGVITIPLAYSRKFKGLYDNLNYPFVLDATKSSTDELIKRTIEMIDNPSELRKKQKKALKEIDDNLSVFIDDLTDVFAKYAK